LFDALCSEQKENNLQLLNKLFAPLHSVEFDDSAGEHYAHIRADLTAQGSLIGANDLMIAAITRANNATRITHKAGEFSRVQGLQIEDREV